jgi:hypothetical protein
MSLTSEAVSLLQAVPRPAVSCFSICPTFEFLTSYLALCIWF